MSAADEAYAAAEAEILRVKAAGETWLNFDQDAFRALKHIPKEITQLSALTQLDIAGTQVDDLAPISSLTNLTRLGCSDTQVSELDPISGLTALSMLFLRNTRVRHLEPVSDLKKLNTLRLNDTQVANLTPITGLTALTGLSLNDTQVADLAPIAGLTALTELFLDDTQVADLRPILNLPDLRLLSFSSTPATEQDANLLRLSEIEVDENRTRQTLAYLRTLPPYPEPLPWLEDAAAISSEKDATSLAPEPDAAMPLLLTDAQRVGFNVPPAGTVEAQDPVKQAVLEEVQNTLNDLIRISGNQNDDVYRHAIALRDRLDKPLAEIEMLKVHFSVEDLRRERAEGGHSPELGKVLTSLVDTAPGLTLDNPQVNTFVDRIARNRLRLLEEAQTEQAIALATSISEAEAQFEEDVRALARRAAAAEHQDQLTGAGPILNRNSVVLIGGWFALEVASNVFAAVTSPLTAWLVANADLILLQARVWGEPFVAWITPILMRAQEITAIYKARNPE